MWEAIIGFLMSDAALAFYVIALTFFGGLLSERHLSLGNWLLKIASLITMFRKPPTNPPSASQ